MAASCDNTLASVWPDDLYFSVLSVGGFVNPGGQVFTLPSRFQNWKVRLFRNTELLDYQDQGIGDPYWTIDLATRVVTLSMDANLGERFSIQAYKPAS